jgi:hypothetical protein
MESRTDQCHSFTPTPSATRLKEKGKKPAKKIQAREGLWSLAVALSSSRASTIVSGTPMPRSLAVGQSKLGATPQSLSHSFQPLSPDGVVHSVTENTVYMHE